MNALDYISNFLTLNGFFKIDDRHFVNEHCEVIVTRSFEGDYYSIHFIDDNMPLSTYKSLEGEKYSEDLNIYWLIGFLTYHNLIDKNYLL